MEKRKEEIKTKLESINRELYNILERKTQLECAEDILRNELEGYLQLELKQEEIRENIKEKKKQEEGENTCGRDLTNSMIQKDDE